MKISYKEAILYILIAVVVVAVVGYFVSVNFAQNYGVSIKLVQLNPQPVTYPYYAGKFKVYINNTGTSSISNLSVATYLNGQQGEVYSASLPPHSGTTINVSQYQFPLAGNYTFQVVADPGHVLNIQNRSAAQSSVTIHVTPAQTPAFYSTIPNNGITTSQSFSLSSTAIAEAGFVSSNFNGTTVFARDIGLGGNVTAELYLSAEGLIKGTQGAYAKYANSSAAYTAWIQGDLNASQVVSVLTALKVPNKMITINTTPVDYATINGTTSLCVLGANGWVKLIEYYNATSSATCATVMKSSYNQTQPQVFVNLLKANPNVTKYQGIFKYNNSTKIGASVTASGNSIAIMNYTQNSNGYFTSYIATNPSPINVTAVNKTCFGLIGITTSGKAVCSVDVAPEHISSFNITYAFVNSTAIFTDYTVTMYSLLNKSYVIPAHDNAIALVDYLGINESSVGWSGVFKSTCSFNATYPFGCKFVSFNSENQTAVINVTSKVQAPVQLNNIDCYYNGTLALSSPVQLNRTLNPGQWDVIKLPCTGTPAGFFGAVTAFNLTMNYTLNGGAKTATGFLNASSVI